MHHPSKALVAAIACAFLIAPAVLAQTASGSLHGDTSKIERSSKIIGKDVRNKDGQNLGRIEDLVFNLNGRISYAVLSFGGFLGVGEKWFAMPWQILSCDQGGKRFVLDIPKERLKDAPGFDKKSWPDMADSKWCAEVSSFYSCPGSADRSWGGKSSSLADATVKDQAGRKLGEVEDLVIDMGRGYATLVILDTYENVEPKDRLVAIPWRAMIVEPKNDVFVYNGDASTLARAETFTKDSWPTLDRSHTLRVNAHFGRDHEADIPIGARGRESDVSSEGVTIRTSRLIGLTCRTSADGEDLGVVRDVVMITGRDRAPMVVVALSGEEGTLRAVPLRFCRTNMGSCILSVDADRVKKSPSFKDSSGPDGTSLAWYDDCCRFYGLN